MRSRPKALHRPGNCVGWKSKTYSPGQCLACIEAHNLATYRGKGTPGSAGTAPKRGPEIPYKRSSLCIHLGTVLPDQDDIKCARDRLHACKIHPGLCSVNAGTPAGHHCETCDDWNPVGSRVRLHEKMSRAALERVLLAGAQDWPAGWHRWPVTGRTMLGLADQAIASCPPVPRDLRGRGIVMTGGGRYQAGLYVAVNMLRHVGCELPIQIWHRGADEPIDEPIRQLAGVEIVDGSKRLPRRPRVYGGWESKMVAIAHCGFAEVIFQDADVAAVSNPEICFDHNPHGSVFFPDRRGWASKIKWQSYGISDEQRSRVPPYINGGYYVFDVARAWAGLNLAAHYDSFSDFYYAHRKGVGGFGDQDQVPPAWARTGLQWTMYTDGCDEVWFNDSISRGAIYMVRGPSRELLFVHRIGCKFGKEKQFSRPPREMKQIPLESMQWRFFRQWLELSS